jgi:hypothetical protein
MEETYAWIVAGAAAGGVVLGVFVLTAYITNTSVRWALRALAAVWLLLPWPIQVVEGYYAPAAVVALFEGLFNRDGNPVPPLSALALASAFVIVVFVIAGWVRDRRGA